MSYTCGVQLTVGVRLTMGLRSWNPGVRGETVDIDNISNPLKGVKGEVGSTDFYLRTE